MTHMRKVASLVSVVAALSFACGGDDTDDSMNPSTGNTTGGSTGGSTGASTGGATTGGTNGGTTGATTGGSTTGGEGDAGTFVCPREQIPAELEMYAGTLTMTQTGYMACDTMCMGDPACYTEANCPGFDAFNECLNMNLFACTAGKAGTCRTAYEDAVCCVTEAQCPNTDASCPMTECPTELSAFQACASADDACIQSAGMGCLLPGRILNGVLPAAELKISDAILLRTLSSLPH
jgi:hypothetical protein